MSYENSKNLMVINWSIWLELFYLTSPFIMNNFLNKYFPNVYLVILQLS